MFRMARSRRKRNKLVPDRWLNYSKIGRVICGTRILALKVPLSEKILSRVTERDRLSPDDVICALPDLRLVVDLTNTDRYYSPKLFKERNVGHVKIPTKGHQIPERSVVEMFFRVLDSFLSSSSSRGLVGVHCTHGVNRTGYLVCRYLIERYSHSALTATRAFSSARGHCIERHNYLTDLHTSSWQPISESVVSYSGFGTILNKDSPHTSSQPTSPHYSGHPSSGRGDYQ